MGEKARARRLLEQAVALKEQWVGSTEHPSESVQPQVCALTGTSNMHGARAGLCLLVLSPRAQACLETRKQPLLAALRCPRGCPCAMESLHDTAASWTSLQKLCKGLPAVQLCSCRTAAWLTRLQCVTALQAAVMWSTQLSALMWPCCVGCSPAMLQTCCLSLKPWGWCQRICRPTVPRSDPAQRRSPPCCKPAA